jgi:DNA-binding MarR family transcriptional regulator
MTELELARTRRCVCGNLRAVSRAVTQVYDEALQPCGLRITQFSLLSTIARLGPIAVTKLAQTLILDQTTTTHNLKLLEQQGWIERAVGPDQRTRLLVLTEPGRQILEKAFPLWEEAQSRIVNGFGQERYRNLLRELAVLAATTN